MHITPSRSHHTIKSLLLTMLFGVVGLCFSVSPVQAATFWDTYIPPELAFQDNLRQTITLPSRININQDSLNQLKVLPGLNEDIALKVMRNRPYADVQDFYRKLPGLDKKRIDRLIEQVQPKIKFQ